MKTLGLILVLGVGVLAMLLAVLPVGTTTTVQMYPERAETTAGLLRVGEIRVENTGIFTRSVALPQFVACIGDREVALDSYTGASDTVVKGVGQISRITLTPGERGSIYLVADESAFSETMRVFYHTEPFSCLTADNPVGQTR